MKIAFIDDNKTVLSINEIVLKKEQFITNEDIIDKFMEIKDLSNETIEYFANNYDLIICDQDLGVDKINGFDFLKKIVEYLTNKEKNNEIVFNKGCVLLTGDDSLLLKAKTAINKRINYVVKNNDKNGKSIILLGEIINKIKQNMVA